MHAENERKSTINKIMKNDGPAIKQSSRNVPVRAARLHLQDIPAALQGERTDYSCVPAITPPLFLHVVDLRDSSWPLQVRGAIRLIAVINLVSNPSLCSSSAVELWLGLIFLEGKSGSASAAFPRTPLVRSWNSVVLFLYETLQMLFL